MSSEPELINLKNIYSSNGNSKKDWEVFAKDINNDSYIDKIIFFLQKMMKENPQNELTVDIIDLIIDFSSPKFLYQIAQKQFLDTFLNLLKSETNAGIEIQKKVIYLTQKWANKYKGNRSLPIFMDNYNFLKNNRIAFPPENFVIKTYDKFISQDEIKNSIYNTQQNQNFNQNNNNNFNYNQNNNTNNSFNNLNYNQNNNNFNNDVKVPNPFDNNNSSFPMPNDDGFPRENNQNNFNNNFNNNNYNNNNFNQNNFNNNNDNNYNPYNNIMGSNNNNNNFNYNNYNNFSNNNNNYNYSNNSSSNFPLETWRQKIRTYNTYIEEGKFSFHATKLKEGIKEILDTFPTIENAINQSFNDNDKRDLYFIKSDMEQTCYRYECLKNDKKIEPFYSAFDGNSKKYFINYAGLFKEKEYIPYSHVEQENQILSGLEKFGNTIKDGAFFVGQKIKDAAVGGYDFVKEKWDERGSNK